MIPWPGDEMHDPPRDGGCWGDQEARTAPVPPVATDCVMPADSGSPAAADPNTC